LRSIDPVRIAELSTMLQECELLHRERSRLLNTYHALLAEQAALKGTTQGDTRDDAPRLSTDVEVPTASSAGTVAL
jgi:hypothetical protein